MSSTTAKNTKFEAAIAAAYLRGFIGAAQLSALGDACRGEERQFFIDKLCQLEQMIRNAPRTYEQEGITDPIAHLHYFTSGCDWYITELDVLPEQHQAFGVADLGYGGELGYISIIELLRCGAELDIHFTPQPVGAVLSA